MNIHTQIYEEFLNSYLDNNLKKYGINIDTLPVFLNRHLRYRIDNNVRKTMKILIQSIYNAEIENIEEGHTSLASIDHSLLINNLNYILNRLYPVLNKKNKDIITYIINNYRLFLNRFENDKEELKEVFNFEDLHIENCSVRIEATDPHHNMDSVYIIQCNHKEIVYKARNNDSGILWNRVLTILNEENCMLNMETIDCLNREDYHWQKYIEHKSCNSIEEIRSLYFRVGVIASLAYIVRLDDLHMENIVTNGDQVHIIDTETIFQVYEIRNEVICVDNASNKLKRIIGTSVIATQFFPAQTVSSIDYIDVSGITGCKISNSVDKFSIIESRNCNSAKNTIRQYSNIGLLNGIQVNPKEYLFEIESGFKEGYELISRVRKKLIDEINKEIRKKPLKTRLIFRNSDIYSLILDLCNNPNYLKKESDQKELLERLLTKTNITIANNIILEAEIEDLLNQNIPFFFIKTGQRFVYDSSKQSCGELNHAPEYYLFEHINRLSEEDMKWQIRLINIALTERKQFPYDYNSFHYLDIVHKPNNIELLRAVELIGNKLIEKAFIDSNTDTLTWLDVKYETPTCLIRPQGLFLYDGLLGNAIFLFSAYCELKNEKYLNAFNSIIKTININYNMKYNNLTGSLFNGLGSLIYFYTFISQRSNNNEYLHEAEQLILNHRQILVSIDGFDLLDGLAGILAILTQVYVLSGNDDIYKLIIEIFDKITYNINKKRNGLYWGEHELLLPGFAHGISGIIFAFAKLYNMSKDYRIKSWIEALLTSENIFYSPECSNGVNDYENYEGIGSLSWCNGVVGIALSRIPLIAEFKVNKYIHSVLKRILGSGFVQHSQCLCHGNFGVIEFLLQCSRIFNDDALSNNLYQLALNEFRCTFDEFQDSEQIPVNLMLGWAGIGYQLLRVYNPIKYPSILLLEA